MQDTQGLKPYQTILEPGESEIVISKSRFLGYCMPVSSEQQAKEAVALIRKNHHDARHCCYAFRLADGGISRSSDDGEPSSTAGAPILSVLAGAGVENALCAVVRYFGGVLLGTGGLTRAYGRAASESLADAKTALMRVCEHLRVTVPYPAYHMLEPLLRSNTYPFETEFTERVALDITVPAEQAEAFITQIVDQTGGNAEIVRRGKTLEALAEEPEKR